MAVTAFAEEMAVALFTKKRERLTVRGKKIRRFAERLNPYNKAPILSILYWDFQIYAARPELHSLFFLVIL